MKISFWRHLADFLLTYRLYVLGSIFLLTLFMWRMSDPEISHEIVQVIPASDEQLQIYQQFRKEFGEDGNTLAVGVEGEFFKLETFNALYDLVDSLKTVPGVEQIIGLTNLFDVVRDDSLERFVLRPLIAEKPQTQEELDSLIARIDELPFYRDLLLDEQRETALFAISIADKVLNSKRKTEVYDNIRKFTDPFSTKYRIKFRYAGMPALRVNVHKVIRKELQMFLILSLVVLSITLLVFFRSFYSVLFPIIVVGIVIVWSLGFMGILGFKINILTGILPALVTVISIPNCVYLITKYHLEYRLTLDKNRALKNIIQKIGIATIMTNATTAAGISTMAFTSIIPLKEFGIIGGLSVFTAFVISVALIPILYSFLPAPTMKQTYHLDRKALLGSLNLIDRIVHGHRAWIFSIAFTVLVLSVYGMTKVVALAHVADDMPKNSAILQDMQHLESRFRGVLPFEVVVDTRQPKGLQRIQNIEKIHELQDKMKTYPDVSRSISLSDLAMFMRQAMFDGGKENYDLPSRSEFNLIKSYLLNSSINTQGVSKTLIDTAFQKTRITATIRDIGSIQMDSLMKRLRTDIDQIFDPSVYKVTITGTTPIFIRGNKFLIENLLQSLVLAFILIAILMGILSRSLRLSLISIIPNVLPLVVVSGIMGFAGIPLKPSTAILFGISFGISVDTAIHFLVRYRQARKHGDTKAEAVSNSIRDTGIGIIYTSLILFLGFSVFLASSFGGTQVLGYLTGTTLIIAMFSNMFVLPALILAFDTDDAREKESVDVPELSLV